MQNCENCRFARWESESGYSSKECGLPSGSVRWIEECCKESDAFVDDGEGCEYFEEPSPYADEDPRW